MADAKKKMGRPTKFNKAASDALIAALSRGAYPETACSVAGISRKTFYNWLNRGYAQETKGETGEYLDFLHTIKKTIAGVEVMIVDRLLAHGADSWQALAWILERRFRGRWAKDSDRMKLTPGAPTNEPQPSVQVVVQAPKQAA